MLDEISSMTSAAFVFWYGGIAQLGERVLCKHEVVGSIPSASTSWMAWEERRKLDQRRLVNESSVNERATKSPRSILFASEVRDGYACVISDIVKRRSFRATIVKAFARTCSRIVCTFSRILGFGISQDLPALSIPCW